MEKERGGEGVCVYTDGIDIDVLMSWQRQVRGARFDVYR